MRRVGVVAIQGDFERHIEAVQRCGVMGVEAVDVRSAEDLEGVERVIIPGGESTTVGMLMQRFGVADVLRRKAAQGMPVWGTCMGMILMARSVVGRDQFTLDLLDIEVERNAFGAQVHSFEDAVSVDGLDEPVMGVFIRAPVVRAWGEAVPIAEYGGQVVAVKQGNRIGTSFHPELTEDTRLHRWFLSL